MNGNFKDFLEQLKEAVRLEEIVAETGRLTVKKAGKNWTTEQHDSLIIFEDTQTYAWYSQASTPGRQGDVFTWLQHHGGIPDFMEAVRWLCQRTGLEYAWSEKEVASYQRQRTKRESLTAVAEFMAELFWKHAPAVAYAKGRGWKEETLKEAKIGYWDWPHAQALREYLQMREIDLTRPEVVAVLGYRGDVAKWGETWGVVVDNDWVEAAHIPGMPGDMLVYPHFDKGKCVYLAGRGLPQEKVAEEKEPEEKKKKNAHWNLRASLVGSRAVYKNVTYNKAGKAADVLIVVEGQGDALTLHQWGFPAIALAGVAVNEPLVDFLKQHKKVVVALDKDAAGEKGAMALATALGPSTLILTWPGSGKDANDWLKKDNPPLNKVKEQIADARPLVVAMGWWAKSVPVMDRAAAERKVYELAADMLPFDYAIYSKPLAQALQVTVPELNRAVKAVRVERDKMVKQPAAPEPPKPKEPNAWEAVIGMSLDEEQETYLKKQSQDHEGHAQCVKYLFGHDLAFVPEWGWLVWDGKKWDKQAANYTAEGFVIKTLKARRMIGVKEDLTSLVATCVCSNNNVTSVMARLERLCVASTEEFDNDLDRVNAANGVIYLPTGTLEPHNRQKFTYCLDTAYRPDADYTTDWAYFLHTSLAKYDEENDVYVADKYLPDLMKWLQMAVGYSLTGHNRENALFYLYGRTRSGKGTFSQTLYKLFGKPLGGNIEFNVLTAPRGEDSQNFALAPLKPCRFLIGSEPGKYERFNDAVTKQLTGADPVTCSFKHGTPFSFIPQFKMWLSANWPFNADPDDQATWGRVRIIHFPNSYLGKEDKELKERLESAECLEGILRWAVDGAVAWYKSGTEGLKTPEGVVQAGKKQRADQDFIGQFLEECTEKPLTDEDKKRLAICFISFADLYKIYVQWCSGVLTPQKSKSFSMALTGKGYLQGKSYIVQTEGPNSGGGQKELIPKTPELSKKQMRGFWGIKLNAEGMQLLFESTTSSKGSKNFAHSIPEIENN